MVVDDSRLREIGPNPEEFVRSGCNVDFWGKNGGRGIWSPV